MAARSLIVALLFLGAGMAGCISGESPAGTLDSGNTTAEGVSDVPPDGRDGRIVAFEETNMTEEGSGGLEHHHDYWGSATRLLLFEGRKPMQPSPDDQNRAYATFRVNPPSLVYEGTGSVEFTISEPERHACEPVLTLGGEDDYVCTDHNTLGVPEAPGVPDPAGGSSGMKLRYRHGATSTWIDAGDLTWGTPLVIQVTDPRQTDMPHSTASLWQFQVVSPNPHDTTLTFHAKAELVRGEGEVPEWPGHPLFYTPEKRFRDIYDGPAVSGDTGMGGAIVPEEAGPVNPERLISYGTRSLYVWANISEVSAPNPATAPTNWYLRYRNATGQLNITDPFSVNHTADVKEHFWILPVDDNGMDSPYADGSRWEFEIYGALTTPALTCYSGCASYVVKYTLRILASDIVEEGKYETYDLND